MLKVLALLICCFALTSAKRASRILHGKEVSQRDARGVFGFVGHVSICGNNGVCGGCTGSLVAPDRFLLAAHCLCGRTDRIEVFLQTTRERQGKRVTGRVLKKAPFACGHGKGYQADKDIGVIKLDENVQGVNPVHLECGAVRPGTQVTMIGFGRDENGNSGTLKYGTRKTMACEKSFKGNVCVDGTGSGITATNPGDSGGPLLIKTGGRYLQVGVTHGATTVSWKEKGRRISKTTLQWTSVQSYCSFIMD